MALTPAQEVAIHNHDDNLIVVAGAGSGKTFVLVERYLALLDHNPEWPLNSLVAVTFTQKAAQEMRDRVRRHIQGKADEAEGEAAGNWARRLAAMDSARIDTIHGLCGSILRGNAAEAGVDPGFEVLDEIEAALLLNNAIDDVFRSLKPDDPLLELFSEYGENNVRSVLKQPEKTAVLSEFTPYAHDLFTEWLTQWIADGHGAVERFAAFLNSAETYAPIGVDSLSERWQDCGEVADWFAEQHERLLLHLYLDQVQRIADLRVPGRIHADWGDDADDAKAAFTAIRDRAKDTLKEIGSPPDRLDQRAAEMLGLWVDLARRVREAYRAAKDERGVLDFDDLESLTRDLLRDETVRARYLGAEFRHVLVDEFQDTNAAQWAIIQRIADPALPGCLFVVGDPKQSIYGFRGADVSVFEQVWGVITAQGQAVDLNTSFRAHRRLVNCLNGLFAQILTRDKDSLVHEYEVAFGGGMQAARETAPSSEPMLELLLLDKEKLKQNLTPQLPLRGERGRALPDAEGEEMRARHASPLQSAEGDEAQGNLTPQPPLHREKGNEGTANRGEWGEENAMRRWEAQAVAGRIKQMVEEGRLIFDKGRREIRPMSYGDVAILFQAMTHVTLYEAALKADGIPYLTVAGKGYYDRQEVWDLLNLLRALYNPHDDLALAAALRSPMFSLSDDALLSLRLIVGEDERTPIPLWKALNFDDRVPADEREQVIFARVTLRDLQRKAGRVTIAELLRLALEATGYLAVLTGLPDGKRRRGNVEELLDKAESVGRITLGSFMEYLNDMQENEAREGEAALESAGAVQLMTVHKSKGLEFPLVVLVDASYERRGGTGDLVNGLACKVYDAESNSMRDTFAYRRVSRRDRLKEEAERKRLFYVAATRAQDTLLISGQVTCKPDKPLQTSGWLKWMIEPLQLNEFDQASAIRGDVRVDFPDPMGEADDDIDETMLDWDAIPAAEPSETMTLLQPLVTDTDALANSMTATQIADLGSARYGGEHSAYYAERWRRSVLHDAPERIDTARWGVRGFAKVGEIVHHALRQMLPERESDLIKLLERYAWEEGIVDPEENRLTVRDALELLERVRRSDVFGWIDGASEVYRQLPFVYQTERRTIHGVIDLLLLDKTGRWRLIDYKTAVVAHNPSLATLHDHARRYHLQMGVYAAAVQTLVGGIAPIADIHYIRYAKTVMIQENDWQSALAQLESYIGDVLR